MPINHLFAPLMAISFLTTPAVAAGSGNDPVNHPMPENRSVESPEPSPATSETPQATASASVQQPMAMGASQMGAVGLTPPGIMMGGAGKWMVGYRYSIDRMDGNLVGTRRISDATVLAQFMAAPTDMAMQMHMGSLMFAPTDKLTLMVMVPYVTARTSDPSFLPQVEPGPIPDLRIRVQRKPGFWREIGRANLSHGTALGVTEGSFPGL